MNYSSLAVMASFLFILGCSNKNDEGSVPMGEKAFSIEEEGYEVRSVAVREALRSTVIRKTPKMESFSVSALPIVTLGYEGPGPDVTATRVLGSMDDPIEIADRGSSLIAALGNDVFVTKKASGFFSYSNRYRLHRFPSVSEIKKEDLVNIALEYIVSKGILSLASEEELTVENVGTVRSATYDATDPAEPVLDGEAVMGYTIIFGRMFSGIPVIGSQIRVDINTDGSVQGFDKLMRPIMSAGEDVPVLDEEQIQGKIEEERVSRHIPDGFRIEGIMCGYIEAGMSYLQGFLQPGCYAALTQGPASEGISMLVSGTGHLVEPILGEKVEYPLPEPAPSPSLDPDDLR